MREMRTMCDSETGKGSDSVNDDRYSGEGVDWQIVFILPLYSCSLKCMKTSTCYV